MNEHSHENPNTGTPDTEIDLLALLVKSCRAIGRGIAAAVKGIGIALAAVFGFCVRHFFLFSGSVISGVLIIIVFGRLSQKNYVTGEAMLTCYGTPLSDLESEIVKLDQIIRTDKSHGLAIQSLLEIDSALARGLRSISFGYGMDIDNDTVPDYVEYTPSKAKNIYIEKTLKGGASGDRIVKEPLQQKVPNLFFLKIETEIPDLTLFHTIGQAVCDYLNRLPSLQVQLQLQRAAWEAQLLETIRQKTLIDSMLRIEYFENSRLKAASFAQGSDKLVLADHKQIGMPFDYKDVLTLTSQQTALQTLLVQSQQIVNITSDFKPVTASMRSKKIWLGLVWVGLFAIGALLYDFRKPIGRYIREQRS